MKMCTFQELIDSIYEKIVEMIEEIEDEDTE